MPASAMTKQGRPAPISRVPMLMVGWRVIRWLCSFVKTLLRIEIDGGQHVDHRLAGIGLEINPGRREAAVPQLPFHCVTDVRRVVTGTDDVLRGQPSLLTASDVDDRRAE